MSLQTQIGPECNIFVPAPEHARQIVLGSPILSQRKLRQILALEGGHARVHRPAVRPGRGAGGGDRAHVRRRPRARCARASSCCCCRTATWCKGKHARRTRCSPPAPCIITWCSTGLRCKCNLLVETGTARDPHHFACLIGYGATAVYPYMAYQVLFEMMRKGRVKLDFADAPGARPQLPRRHPQGPVQDHVEDGHLDHRAAIAARSCSRSSVSRDEVVELCFTGTESRVQGADFADLEAGPAAARRARLESARADRAGRPAQVHARRRVPHVQPGRDRRAAGGGDVRGLRALPASSRSW